MSSIESQVRDAFASIEPPEGVRMRTLAAIEARRGSQIAAPDARKAEAGEARAASRRGSGKGLPARKRLRFMVAACLALALCFGTTFAYAAETAQVEIQTDGPAVTLGLNRFNTVRSASVDEDYAGFEIDLESLRGMQYEDALEALLQQADAEGEPGAIVISVTCGNAGQTDRINNCSAERLRLHGHADGMAQGSQNGQHHGNGSGYGNRYGQTD